MQRVQTNSITHDMNDTADLNQNGKRSALVDEMQEILEVPQEKQGSGEATILRLCRYSK